MYKSQLTWVVPDKGPLNGCVCVYSRDQHGNTSFYADFISISTRPLNSIHNRDLHRQAYLLHNRHGYTYTIFIQLKRHPVQSSVYSNRGINYLLLGLASTGLTTSSVLLLSRGGRFALRLLLFWRLITKTYAISNAYN